MRAASKLLQIHFQPLQLKFSWWIFRIINGVFQIRSNARKFRKVISNIESLMIGLGIFIVNESNFLIFFSVNNVSKQQIVVTKKYWRFQFLKLIIQLDKLVTQKRYRWKYCDDPNEKITLKFDVKWKCKLYLSCIAWLVNFSGIRSRNRIVFVFSIASLFCCSSDSGNLCINAILVATSRQIFGLQTFSGLRVDPGTNS